MKKIFEPGETREYSYTVTEADKAAFHGRTVHNVCSTFTLAREIEWSTRLFVLDMKEDDEEGVGTMLTIDHRAPAFVGETLHIRSEIKEIRKNELICIYKVLVNNRLVAEGTTGQKILKKSRLKEIFSTFEKP